MSKTLKCSFSGANKLGAKPVSGFGPRSVKKLSYYLFYLTYIFFIKIPVFKF